jgi:hypothetical protein
MTDLARLLWTSTIWVAIASAAAALIAGYLSRAVKISEFRQAWINDLREDIANYIGSARKWYRAYVEVNDLDPGGEDKDERERKEVFPLATDALVILWRVKLRFNPRSNRDKAQDGRFLKMLDALIEPGQIFPSNPLSPKEAGWDKRAAEAVAEAQEILKREWEVTKSPKIALYKWLNAGGLALGMVGVVFIFAYGRPQLIFRQQSSVVTVQSTSSAAEKPVARDSADAASTTESYRYLADAGLGLIFLGFFCQFVGALRSKV